MPNDQAKLPGFPLRWSRSTTLEILTAVSKKNA